MRYYCVILDAIRCSTRYDKLYFLAPKNWRIANLICRIEPNRTERVMKKTKNKYNGLPMTMGGHKDCDWTLMMCERILLRSFLWATICKTVRPICYRTVVCLSLLWPPCVGDADVIFCSCGYFLSSFFLACSQRSEIGCLPCFHTWCGLSANLECRSEMCCTRLAGNTGRKSDAKIAICAPSHNFVGSYLCN